MSSQEESFSETENPTRKSYCFPVDKVTFP